MKDAYRCKRRKEKLQQFMLQNYAVCITIDCNIKIIENTETVKRCVKRRIRYYSYTDDTSYRLNYHDDYLEFRFFLATPRDLHRTAQQDRKC